MRLGVGDKPEGGKFELFGLFRFPPKMSAFGTSTQKLPTFSSHWFGPRSLTLLLEWLPTVHIVPLIFPSPSL